MKKTTLYIALLAGAFALLNSTQTATSATEGCCVGGACAQMMSDPATPAAKPDLLTTCPVSGEKLGEMGAPLVFTYKDQEVKLCCKNSKKDFDKDPEKYMKLIRAADKK